MIMIKNNADCKSGGGHGSDGRYTPGLTYAWKLGRLGGIDDSTSYR